MATIKSYTDIKQSKKLAKFLPIESADMWYEDVGLMIPRLGSIPKEHTDTEVPCWSLAALLGVLPTLDDRNANFCKDIRYDKWHVYYHSTATLSIIDTERYDNPVDACYEMIVRLHELNLL